MSRVHDSSPPSRPPRRRFSLLFLIIPVILYILTPVVANSIEPRILGVPFIISYTIAVTILTWLFVWMAARGDRYYRENKAEYVPSDVAFGEDYPIEEASASGGPASGSSAAGGEEAGK